MLSHLSYKHKCHEHKNNCRWNLSTRKTSNRFSSINSTFVANLSRFFTRNERSGHANFGVIEKPISTWSTADISNGFITIIKTVPRPVCHYRAK